MCILVIFVISDGTIFLMLPLLEYEVTLDLVEVL